MSNCIEYASLNRVDGIEGHPELYVPGTVAVRGGGGGVARRLHASSAVTYLEFSRETGHVCIDHLQCIAFHAQLPCVGIIGPPHVGILVPHTIPAPGHVARRITHPQR